MVGRQRQPEPCADQFQSDLLASEADTQVALIALAGFLGRNRAQTTLLPLGKLEPASRTFSLSNWHTAEIESARLLVAQAAKTLEAAEQKVEIDLRQAFTRYQLSVERVARFKSATLEGAEKVLAAKRYSYQRGQTTLLDLLAAQRSANEVYLADADALADAAKGLIELERAAQLWDVSF